MYAFYIFKVNYYGHAYDNYGHNPGHYGHFYGHYGHDRASKAEKFSNEL